MPTAPEQVFVKVEGEQLELGAGKLISVTIDQTLDLPDFAEISLVEAMEWLAQGTFDLGKEVKVDLKIGDKRETMFIGEVTAAEPTYTEGNVAKLVVRCFDRAHRLSRGRKSKTFEQVKDSDIVQRIANDHGLGTEIESTSKVHDHIYQHNQSDLEFLMQRAKRIGYQVGVSDKKLYFKTKGKPTRGFASSEPVEMKWGESLQYFSPKLNSSRQVNKVTVRGWNPDKKEAVIGEASSSNSGPEVEMGRGGGRVDSVFGTEAVMTYVSEHPIYSQEEADTVAQAKLDELQVDYITALGRGEGNPSIQPGAKVKVSRTGKFDGEYLVADAKHRFKKGGYEMEFRVGHGDPKMGGAGAKGGGAAAFSVGIVTDNVDPTNAGRVRIKLPSLGEDIQTDWARIMTPSAGNDRGMFWLPEINDEVLVAFEQGEAARPIVLGALWNGQDNPPLKASDAVSGGKVMKRMLKSRGGHMILLDDNDGNEQISIEDSKGNKIVFETKENKLVIDFQGDIEMKAGKNITIEAGMNIDIKAGMQLNAKGTMTATFEGGTTTTVKATGPMSIQGVPVAINTGAITVM